MSKHRSRGLSPSEEEALEFAADIVKSVTDRHRQLPPELSLLRDHEKITAIRKCGSDCKMKHRQPEWFYTVDGVRTTRPEMVKRERPAKKGKNRRG